MPSSDSDQPKVSPASPSSTLSGSGVPVYLYVPNILGYTRIFLAFYGLYISDRFPVQTIYVFLLSASLDLIDGILARALNQTSSFGILVDIAADNILRTVCWMAATTSTSTSATNASQMLATIAALIISIEWMTMISTQLHAAVYGNHWKKSRENDPWLVRALFANNFRNPIGMLSMYGLFSANLWTYGAQHSQLYDNIPYFELFRYVAYLGRALSLVVELWMIQNYLKIVIAKDEESERKED